MRKIGIVLLTLIILSPTFVLGDCDYDSTQARFHTFEMDGDTEVPQPLHQELTVEIGTEVKLVGVHNGEAKVWDDARFVVEGPDDFQISSGDCEENCRITEECPSQCRFTPPSPGEYTLYVTTEGQDGAACEDTATLTVTGTSGGPTEPEVCDDFTDNDGDGKIDCEDTDDCEGESCGTDKVCTSGSCIDEDKCNPVLRKTSHEASAGKYKSGRTKAIDRLVYHYTGDTLEEAFEKFADDSIEKSLHYVIDRDGSVYWLVNEEDTALHANCNDPTSDDCIFNDIDNRSIGIGLVNSGYTDDSSLGYPYMAEERPAECTSIQSYWEPYDDTEQMESLVKLTIDILNRNTGVKADRTHIIGHDEIDCNAHDPGAAFPWEYVMTGIHECHEEPEPSPMLMSSPMVSKPLKVGISNCDFGILIAKINYDDRPKEISVKVLSEDKAGFMIDQLKNTGTILAHSICLRPTVNSEKVLFTIKA